MSKLVLPQLTHRPVYQVERTLVPRLYSTEPKFAHAYDEMGGKSWHQACGRKIAYFTQENAEKAFAVKKYRYHKKGKVLNVYLCPWCDWWHLGHSSHVGGEGAER